MSWPNRGSQPTISGVKGVGNPVNITTPVGMSFTGVQWYRNGVAIAAPTGTANPYIQTAADIPAPGGSNIVLYPVFSGVVFSSATFTNVADPIDPSSPLLRFASPYNRISGTSVTMGAGKQTAVTTTELLTTGTGGLKSLRLRFENLVWAQSSIIGPGNAANFTEGYLVCNGVSKPILFSGAATAIFSDGGFDYLSDPFLPTDFGLTEFPSGIDTAARWTITCPASGKLPFKAYNDNGNRGFYYDPAVTTITNLPAPVTTASISYSGAAPNLSYGGSCQLVGEYTTGDPRVVARLGDSFEERGPLTSATLNAALRTPTLSSCQIGHSGSESTLVTTAPEIAKSLLKYANVVNEEFGTNSVNLSRSLATMQQNSLDVWALIRSSKSNHPKATPLLIFRPRLLTVTSGVFSTLVGQVTSAGFLKGALADQFWDWLNTKVGTADGVTMTYEPWFGVGGAVRGSTDNNSVDFYKFAPNMTDDGTHIVAAGAVIGGANTRPAWDAVTS